jgi:glycerate 2-kinase
MSALQFPEHNQHLRSILRVVMQSADPSLAVRQHFSVDGSRWMLAGSELIVKPSGRIFMLAVGKAAPGMASAVAARLSDRLASGLIVHPAGSAASVEHPSIKTLTGGHPLPDANSLRAGRATAELLGDMRPEDIVLCLISGGASAMLELPVQGVGLQDLIQITQSLLKSGATIGEINTIRKALSQLKGGRLLSRAAPARVVSLILSDVIGDNLADVGSGPTVAQSVSSRAARSVLLQYGLWDAAPETVRLALAEDEPGGGEHPEPVNALIGSNRLVVQAAAQAAADLGFKTLLNPRPVLGEARRAAAELAVEWVRGFANTSRPWAHVSGGETTVTVAGTGRGGRNQEFALAAALELEGQSGLAVMSLATDGVDGPTDAAGAIITPQTAGRIRACGMDPRQALQENDSYHALKAAGALLRTGPSGTNLNDLIVALAYSG